MEINELTTDISTFFQNSNWFGYCIERRYMVIIPQPNKFAKYIRNSITRLGLTWQR